MCLSVDLLVCPTLISLSLFYEQYSSSNSGIFQLYFFKYSFCLLFISFLSFWGSQYKYVGLLHHIPQISEVLFSFIHSFFLLFLRLDNFNISIIRCIHSSILICYWTPLAKILFHLLYFSTLVFPFGSFLIAISLYYLFNETLFS